MLTLAADNDWMLGMAKWIPTLPFLSMVICGLLCCSKSESVRKLAAWVTVAAIAGAFVCATFVSSGLATMLADQSPDVPTTHAIVHFFQWINIGDFAANFSFYIDSLTIVMLYVVTGIGTLIAIYAAGYMAGDAGYPRFFAYISLFIFAMTCLVLADNLLLLYLGWEGVGAASYLLIGYYCRKPSAVNAAKKAFIVNRVGDFGFALGLMCIFVVFGTIQYGDFLPAASELLHTADHSQLAGESLKAYTQASPYWDGTTAEPGPTMILLAIPFLLMLGAFGKSAQLPLHVWLPDAMEGPTPVSALIHAATMVTAGVYMIARLIPVFQLNEAALMWIAVTGAVTALFAATIALCQYDLKRVWAYSTLSQLGYMFLGVGVLGTMGAVFHLYTHAFFKALLFLTAGSVMHALAGQLDLRKMSGLRHKMPVTCWLMFAGCLALAGVPFTAGFFSKDTILTDAMIASPVLGLIGVATALLTAFYTFRLWFRVFWGPEQYEMGDEHHGYSPTEHPWIFEDDAHGHDDAHGDDHGHDDHAHHEPHEMPWAMNGPLLILAVGAIAAGFMFNGWMGGQIDASSAHVTHHYANDAEAVAAHDAHHHMHVIISWVSGGGAVLMIALAYYFHVLRRDKTEAIAERFKGVVKVLYNKYYIDELYEAVIRKPLNMIGGWGSFMVDRLLVDGVVVDWLLGRSPRGVGQAMRPMLRGALQGYGLTMGLGLVAILAVVAWKVLT